MREALKTLTWKPVTQHFKAHYLPLDTTSPLQVYYKAGEYAIVNPTVSEYAKAPLFVVNTLLGQTYEKERGPFIFKNGFDETPEAQYMIRLLQYSELTVGSRAKIVQIQQQYSDWISYDFEVKEILRRHIRWL